MKIWERSALFSDNILSLFDCIDVSTIQIVIFGAYNVLSADNSPEGFLLLRIMRSYLELDMYASLTMHTEATLATGRAELKTYDSLVQVSQSQY